MILAVRKWRAANGVDQRYPKYCDLRIWTCMKSTRNINGALPAPRLYKSVCAARGQHNAAPWRTIDRYARRWEGLRRTQFASMAYLLILSFSPSFLLLLQSVLTWLSWGIKLLRLKWIQEAIFGLQVRIIVKSASGHLFPLNYWWF